MTDIFTEIENIIANSDIEIVENSDSDSASKEYDGIEIRPTQTKINLNSPVSNTHFVAGMTLYVTKNEFDRIRVIGSYSEFELNSVHNVRHATRHNQFGGKLTIIGMVETFTNSDDCEFDGEIPSHKLPFRIHV